VRSNDDGPSSNIKIRKTFEQKEKNYFAIEEMKQNYFVSQQENLLETWEKVFFSHSFIRHKKRSRKLGKTCAEMLHKSG